MTTFTSGIKTSLGVTPTSIKSAALFNEGLQLFSAVKALQVATSEIFVGELTADHEAPFYSAYIVNALSKMFFVAGEDITAGKFLEAYYSSGWKVRRTRCNTSSQSTGVVGITLADVKVGEIATVVTCPAIVSGFTGLVPKRVYYAYDLGTFVAVSSKIPVGGASYVELLPCGIAVSPTALQLMSPL